MVDISFIEMLLLNHISSDSAYYQVVNTNIILDHEFRMAFRLHPIAGIC